MEDVGRITAAIADGDAEALGVLYRARFDFLYGAASRFTGLDESACMDIVHDAMLRVIRRMKRFDDAAVLDAWLTRVVRTAALDRIRRERRRRVRELVAAESRRAASTAAPPDDLSWLRSELSRLDIASRQLLAMRFARGLTLERIGAVLGVGPGAADGRLRRTISGLRARAEERADD